MQMLSNAAGIAISGPSAWSAVATPSGSSSSTASGSNSVQTVEQMKSLKFQAETFGFKPDAFVIAIKAEDEHVWKITEIKLL